MKKGLQELLLEVKKFIEKAMLKIDEFKKI
jgi:hypothetical protein